MNTKNLLFSINLDRNRQFFKNLKPIVEIYNPISMAVQDIWLTTKHELLEWCKLYTRNYKIYWDDPPSDNIDEEYKIDAAILVRKDIEFLPLDTRTGAINGLTHQTLVAVYGLRIKLEGHKSYSVYSVYLRPLCPPEPVTIALNYIEYTAKKFGTGNLVVAGDLNSFSLQWSRVPKPKHSQCLESASYRNMTEKRGTLVIKFMDELQLECINRPELGPTMVNDSLKQQSFTDVIMVGQKALKIWNDSELLNLTGGTYHRILVAKKTRLFFRAFLEVRDESAIK